MKLTTLIYSSGMPYTHLIQGVGACFLTVIIWL